MDKPPIHYRSSPGFRPVFTKPGALIVGAVAAALIILVSATRSRPGPEPVAPAPVPIVKSREPELTRKMNEAREEASRWQAELERERKVRAEETAKLQAELAKQKEELEAVKRELAEADEALRSCPPRAPLESEAPHGNLSERLAHFRAWAAKHTPSDSRWNLSDEETLELSGIRDLIVDDPATFVAFAKDEDHEALLCPLLTALSGIKKLGPNRWQATPLDFEMEPRPLLDGLLALARQGSRLQRLAALDFLAGVEHQPGDFREAYFDLFENRDAETKVKAAEAILRCGRIAADRFGLFRKVAELSREQMLISACVRCIVAINSDEAETWLVGRLEAVRDRDDIDAILYSLWGKTEVRPAQQERYAAAMAALVKLPLDETALGAVLHATLALPAAKALPVLEKIQPAVRPAAQAARIKRILQAIRGGETRGEELRHLLYS